MKRIIALLIVVMLISPFVCQASMFTAVEDNPFLYFDKIRQKQLNGEKVTRATPAPTSGEDYIVKFRETVDFSDIYDAVSPYSYTLLAFSEQRLFKITLQDAAQFIALHNDIIAFAEPDGSSDFYEDDIWQVDGVNAPAAWQTTQGEGVVIAVIDTGISRAHQAFANANILAGYNVMTGEVGAVDDTVGHGTRVTSIIVAEGLGIAPKATILPLKIADYNAKPKTSDIVNAIIYAADYGARIINMSFGSYTKTQSEEEAVAYAILKGCILVAAAGNDGSDLINYPAGYDGVVGVGSIDKFGLVANHSNHNPSVDVTAPGVELQLADFIDGESGYLVGSGTSYATAFVTATAALAASLRPLSAMEFEKILEYCADHPKDEYYGWGILDAARVLDELAYPIILGVSNDKMYFEAVSPTFSQGVALLNGEVYTSGEVIFNHGTNKLAVTHNGKTRTITFHIDTTKLTYNLIRQADGFMFTFNRGIATLDELPYISGTKITASGEYNFVLTGPNGNTVSETVKFIKELPTVYGVENNKTYTTPIAIRVVGEGQATLNGTPFNEDIVAFLDGDYTLTIENLNKTQKVNINFTIRTTHYQKTINMSGMTHILADETYNFAAFNSGNSPIVFVKDLTTLGSSNRVLIMEDDVIHMYLGGDSFIVVTQSGYSVFTRQGQTNQTNYSMNGNVLDCAFSNNTLFYLLDDNAIYKTEIGSNIHTKLYQLSVPITSFAYDSTTQTFCAAYGNEIFAMKSEIIVHQTGIDNMGAHCAASNGVFFADGYAYINGKPIYDYKGEVIYANNHVFIADNKLFSISDGMCLGDLGINIIAVTETSNSFYLLTSDNRVVCAPKNTIFTPSAFEYYGFAHVSENILGNSYQSDHRRILNLHSSLSFQYVVHDAASEQIFAIANNHCIYVFTENMSLINTIWLRFTPTSLYVDAQSRVWAGFGDTNLIYFNGQYFEIEHTPEYFMPYNGKLYYCNTSRLFEYDLESQVTRQILADQTVENFTIADGSLYIYGALTLQRFDFAANTLICAESAAFRGDMRVKNGVLSAGQYLFDAQTLATLCNAEYYIHSYHNNAAITNHGLYAIGEQTYLQNRLFEYDHAVITTNYTSIFFKNNKITLLFGDGDITQPASINLENNGVYFEEATVVFDKGTASVNGIPITSGYRISAAGKHTLIIVRAWNIRQQVIFTVKQMPNDVALNRTTLKLDVGDTFRLRATLQPIGAEGAVVFSSDNPDVVAVDDIGNLTAVSFGTAVITATVVDRDITAQCTVSVTPDLISPVPNSGFAIDRSTGTIYINSDIVVLAKNIMLTYMDQPGEYVLRGIGGEPIVDGEEVVVTGITLEKWSNGELLDSLIVVVKGDLDGDGFITVMDADEVYHILQNGLADEIAPHLFTAADFNNSRLLNENDYNLMLAYVQKNTPHAQSEEIYVDFSVPCFATGDIWVEVTIPCGRKTQAVTGIFWFSNATYLSYSSSHKQMVAGLRADGALRYSVVGLGDSFEDIKIRFHFNLHDSADFGHAVDLAQNGKLIGGIYSEAFVEMGDSPCETLTVEVAEAIDFDLESGRLYAISQNELLTFTFNCPAGGFVFFNNRPLPLNQEVALEFTYIDPKGKATVYSLVALRGEEVTKSDDNTLKSVVLDGFGEIFADEYGVYSAVVDYDFASAVVIATANDPNAVVESPPQTALVEGENTLIITCTAEDLSVATYTVVITRTPPPQESSEPASSQPAPSSQDETSQLQEPPNDSFYGIIFVIIIVLIAAATASVVWRRHKL